MRIIAGTHRSRKLHAPDDAETTRPITDRVKQAMFDRLVSMELMGGNVADVFAGTGSLGLEALSRGADHCVFVERDRKAAELLHRNIEELQFKAVSRVVRSDALSPVWPSTLTHAPLRLVLLDPPYPLTRNEKETVKLVSLMERLALVVEEGGAIVLRTDETTAPPSVPSWSPPQSFNYGSMTLHFYLK